MKVKIFFILTLIIFSFSNAQNMFFHLLPGFGTPFTWVGLGLDANWTTPENWNTAQVPGASDVATFDNSCLSNCDPLINVSITLRGVNVKSTYAGLITQASGQAITIGSSGWVQAGGTFQGGDTNMTFNASGITLSDAAVFNAATAQTFFDLTNGASLDVVTVPATATLSFPNNSIQRFRLQGNCGGVYYRLVSPQKLSFYDLITDSHTVGCGSPRFNAPVGGLEVRNDYSHIGSSMASNGNFEVYGNISLSTDIEEASTWTVAGSVSKIYTGPGSIGKLVVNKTGGATFTPANAAQTFGARALDVISGEFTFPQTFNMFWAGGSTAVHFKIGTGTVVNVPTDSTININNVGACGGVTKSIDVDGLFNFENLSLIGSGTGCGQATMTLASGDVLVVKKNFNLGHSFAANFNITVEGDYATTGAPNGTMAVSLVNGTAASWTQAAVGTVSGLVTVSKPGLITTAASNISLTNSGQSLNISDGTVNLAGRNLSVNNALTIGVNGKLICNGGSVAAFSWTINGEVSCGTTIGITWTGLAGDNLWSTPGNWTNNTVPGASDIAIFNGMCTGLNCNVQSVSNLSVRGISILSGYAGTFTMSTGHSLTVGTAGFSQAAGIFVGGDSAFVNRGTYAMSGGTFTATSAAWTQHQGVVITGASIFNHNNGSIIFTPFSGGGTSIVINATPATFNNVSIGGTYLSVDLAASTLQVNGTLTLTDSIGTSQPMNNGTISARGNIQLSNAGKFGTVIINVEGTGAQSLTGLSTGYVPTIRINKPSGTLTLIGTINSVGNWAHLAGTVDAGSSTLIFTYVSGSGVEHSITPGTMVYNHVNFQGGYVGINLNSGVMNIQGNLTLADSNGASSRINSGTLHVAGDVILTSEGKWGSAVIVINGTGNQTLTGVSTAYIPTVQINKPSGVLTLVGTINSAGNWTHLAGTVDAGTSTLIITHGSSSGVVHTINPGSVIYNNVTFQGGYVGVTLTNAMTVQGNLILNGATGADSALNGSQIFVRGNLTATSAGKFGTTTIVMDGTGTQTLSGVSGANVQNLQINKAAGVLNLVGTIQSSGNWSHLAGTVNAGTSTVVLTYYSFGANLSITPGTVDYQNLTIQGSSLNYNLNAQTLKVFGNLTLNGSSGAEGNITNGLIEAHGSVIVSGGGKIGSANLMFVGASNANLTWTSGSFLDTTVEISKTGGASVVLLSNASFSTAGRDLTITSGTLDLNGFDLSINDRLTVAATGILKCNGGEFTTGTLINSGLVNCPGYSTYDFNWTGAGGNANWTTAGNWQGGVAPGANDILYFADTYCGANCNSNINASASVKGMILSSLFTGTITQGSGNTLTVGTRGYSQASGSFVGSDSNITVALNAATKSFSLTGGTFTATTALFQVGFLSGAGGYITRDTFIVGAGAVFNHNNGSVRLACYEANSGTTLCRINAPAGLAFNNLSTYALNGYGGGVAVTAGQTVVVNGNMTVESGAIRDLQTGYFEVHRDLSINSDGSINSRPGIIRLVGTGDQAYSISGAGCTARIEINKPSGQVLPGVTTARICSLDVISGSFTAPTGTLYLGVPGHSIRGNVAVLNLSSPSQYIDQGGTVDFNSIDLWSGTLIYSIITNGNLTLSNVITRGVTGFTGGQSISGGGKIIVTNSFEKASGRLGGDWELQGNASFAGMSDATATFSFTGAANQNISGASAGSSHWTVNKTGGAMNLTSHINLSKAGQNLIITNGQLNLNGYNLTVNNNIQNLGVINRGTNPVCGIISQGGSFTGNAAICP